MAKQILYRKFPVTAIPLCYAWGMALAIPSGRQIHDQMVPVTVTLPRYNEPYLNTQSSHKGGALMPESQKWMRLDNAAKIFPAVKRRDWSNVFRLSATLRQPVDPQRLQEAVALVAPRFPSMFVSLHRGLFWYYLEQLPEPPQVRLDSGCPLIHMTSRELETCALRVLYFQNRIAVEFFHSITDGNGGLVFLKTLTAAYVSLEDGRMIPPGVGVLDWHEPPDPAEWEDSFLKVAGQVSMSRREENAFRIQGIREPDGFLHLTVATIDAGALRDLARRYGVTITAFLSAVMLEAILELRPRRSKKWAKVTIPVDLRRLFDSRTLRNFALTVNVGVDPRLGAYSLDELCKVIQGQLAMQVTPQQMAARVAANVNPEQALAMKVVPLPFKNLAMRLAYRIVGECKGTLNISNLGLTQLPEELAPYVANLDFIIGPQLTYFNNCGVVSYGGKTRINLIRSIREPELERRFLTKLVELGLEVTVESNQRRD